MRLYYFFKVDVDECPTKRWRGRSRTCPPSMVSLVFHERGTTLYRVFRGMSPSVQRLERGIRAYSQLDAMPSRIRAPKPRDLQ